MSQVPYYEKTESTINLLLHQDSIHVIETELFLLIGGRLSFLHSRSRESSLVANIRIVAQGRSILRLKS